MMSHTGKIHPAVCDGNTIGFLCCAVHDCKIPLVSNHHRFCATHAFFPKYCAVTDCPVEHTPGHRTCDNPEHRVLEKAYYGQSKAIFQLCEKLKRTGVTVPADSVAIDPAVLDEEVVIECEGKPEGGNHRLWACFGHWRTHNEQLIMQSCGAIFSHGSMYGSEGMPSVYVSLMPCLLTPFDSNGFARRNSPKKPSLCPNLPLSISSLIQTASYSAMLRSLVMVILSGQACLLMSFTSKASTKKVIHTASNSAILQHSWNSSMVTNGTSIHQFENRPMFG
jgi:hypothetical protein